MSIDSNGSRHSRKTTAAAGRSPSPDGSNGEHAAAVQPENAPQREPDDNGRDARGRFTQGNGGGPGNPFARKVAALRAALMACVTEDDIKDILAALMLKAKSGDAAAARLVLAYTVGRPAETVDPDRLDEDEWQKVQQAVARPGDVERAIKGLPTELASRLIGATVPALGDAYADRMLGGLKALDDRDRRRAERKRRKEEKRAARARRLRGAPSANGGNGRLPGLVRGGCGGG